MRFSTVSVLAALSFVAPSFGAPQTSSLGRKGSLFATTHTVVSDLQSSVIADVDSIADLVAGEVTDVIVPDLATDLEDIAKSIETALVTLVPTVATSVIGLVLGEVGSLLQTVETLKDVVSRIVDVVDDVVGGLPQDIVALLTTEITNVLQLLDPLVSPILTLVDGVVSQAEPTDSVATLLAATVADIKAILASVVAPVGQV
ncbi:hypothetical protein B0O99DRAFT_600835 [Bisporella sp. PMI_857]|nr:hypothetical protein B0O99DRAFT_600835 [Bisporella sp. PMI_857]